MQPTQIRHCAYARWTWGLNPYAVCDSDADPLQSGVQHDPVLIGGVDLAERFIAGQLRASDGLTLDIADVVGGSYRTQVATLEGTQCAVEIVSRITFDDGTTATHSYQQTLTMQGTELSPTRVRISLVDLEDQRLGELYPPTTWETDAWPGLWVDDAGRPVARPVGTALKVPAALILADDVNSEYFYGLCEAPSVSVAVAAVSTGSKTFSIAGDYTDRVSAGSVIWVDGSTSNDNRYTVTAAAYSAPNTVITVSETIASSTANGSVLIFPTVLAVYRDGRLVPSSEYQVHLLDEATAQWAEPEFSAVGSEWILSHVGTGSASVIGGKLQLTGDGGGSNYGVCYANSATPRPLPNSWYPCQLKLDAGVLSYGGFTATHQLTSTGEHWRLVQQVFSGNQRILLANFNTGSATTVQLDYCRAQVGVGRWLLLRFTTEQVGFDGAQHQISCDIRGVDSRNAVSEIGRLLQAAGITIDATTFATAAAYANTHRMLVDCDHGRGEQRRIRAIVEDLLFIARATLYRASSGSYAIAQDTTATLAASRNEAADAIDVSSLKQAARPSSVGLRYRPSTRDPSQLQHTIRRDVTGGTTGEAAPRDVRYLRDHEAADRLLCYLALREQYNRRLSATEYAVDRRLAQRVAITSAPLGLNAAEWTVQSATRIPGGVSWEAVEYVAAVHTYTPGDLPPDAVTGYTPDYSNTPPAAPTSLTITAGAAALGTAGELRAYIDVSAAPPAVNWSAIWFYAEHNTTGEIPALIRGSVAGGVASATLTGLRPGEVYQLHAYAINEFDQLGVVQSSFNATAIGGGNPVTTFTAPGYATLPPNVGSCNASQGSALMVQVRWSIVSTAALLEYVLERSANGGAYAEVWRGRGLSYIDRDVFYASNYTYRVKARDTYGNLSASWATSGGVLVSANISGGASGDITSNTVATSNRTSTSTASSSGLMLSGDGFDAGSVAHGLGKAPLATVSISASDPMIACATGADASAVSFAVMRAPSAMTTEDGTVSPHSHTLQFAGGVATYTVTVSIW